MKGVCCASSVRPRVGSLHSRWGPLPPSHHRWSLRSGMLKDGGHVWSPLHLCLLLPAHILSPAKPNGAHGDTHHVPVPVWLQVTL